jgi:hypothetical protein
MTRNKLQRAGRRRQSADQSRLRPLSRQRENRDPEYEGNIFEYPETAGDQSVQFAPAREYHDEYLYS